MARKKKSEDDGARMRLVDHEPDDRVIEDQLTEPLVFRLDDVDVALRGVRT